MFTLIEGGKTYMLYRMSIIPIFLIIMLLISCASMPGHNEYRKLSSPSITQTSEKGTVIFFRESRFVGGGVTYYIYDGNNKIGASWSGCYFHYLAEPGDHTFWGETEAKKYITLNIAAGKTYYIETSFGFGALIGVPAFTVVTENVALPLLKDINYCELIKITE